MTPQQKARELVGKFKGYAFYDITDKRAAQINDEHSNAKDCALIAVDELIAEFTPLSTDYSMGVGYWQEVKKEIDLL